MSTRSLSQPSRLSHLRALAAITRKDWLVFWRYPLNGLSLVTQPLMPVNVEVGIIVVFMFVMTWLGMVVFRRLERRMKQLGTLGTH